MPDEISLDTVKQHSKPNDLWVVINNKVYNLTKFRSEHPGGEQVLDDVAGRNATKEFNDVGHSDEAKKLMEKYFVGNLAAKDCKTQLPLREIGIIAGAAIVAILAGFLVKKAMFRK